MAIFIVARKKSDRIITLDLGSTPASQFEQVFWRIDNLTPDILHVSSALHQEQTIDLHLRGGCSWEDIEETIAEQLSESVDYCVVHTLDGAGHFTGGIPVLIVA